jgi:dCTP deaminase
MFLSDTDIDIAIRSGEITLEPFNKKQLQPASYDIRLGNEFIMIRPESAVAIDPAKGVYPEAETIEIDDGEPLVLQPGMSVIGYSKERFGSESHLIEINSKSSLTRIGLLVHNSSGIVNPGHFLCVALVLSNLNTMPIILRPDMAIAQLIFSPLSSAVKKNYDEKRSTPQAGAYLPPRSGPLSRIGKKFKRK